MYVDRPRVGVSAWALPLSAATFFAVCGIAIAVLSALVLPPAFWAFTAPAIALCLALIVAIGRHVVRAGRLEYRIESGVLHIRAGSERWWFRVQDVIDVVPAAAGAWPRVHQGTIAPDAGRTWEPPREIAPSLHAHRPNGASDRSGAGSARNLANHASGNLLINVGGDWVRLSPTDPAAFTRALLAARMSQSETGANSPACGNDADSGNGRLLR